MPTGDAACTWVQELAAEGTPDGFPKALTTRAMILPLWMEAASLRGGDLQAGPGQPSVRPFPGGLCPYAWWGCQRPTKYGLHASGQI